MKTRLMKLLLAFLMLLSFLPSTTVHAADLTVTDKISEDGRLYVTGGTGPYTWEKKTGSQSYTAITRTNYDVVGYNLAADGSWVNVPLTDGGITEDSYVTYRVTDVTGATKEFQQRLYSQKLLNGSFETPSIEGSYKQYPVGTTGLFWKTTGSDKAVEIAVANGNYFFGVTSTVHGRQFGELNCEAVGSLYQDVMTVPGETLNWSFAHRARLQSWGGGSTQITYYSGEDVMALVIMPTTKYEQSVMSQEDVMKIVNNPKDYGAYVLKHSADRKWDTVSGNYVVPQGQYLTRFFFVSVSSASKNATIGNLIDNVYFTTEKTQLEDTATLSLKKVATSSDSSLTTFPKVTVHVYDSVDGVTKGNLRWTVDLVANGQAETIINVEKGTYIIEEANAEIEGYKLTTSYQPTSPITITDKDLNKTVELTITNTYTEATEKVNVTAKKVWVDALDQDGMRKDSVTVKLYADGVDTTKSIKLTAPNWTGSFVNLPKYKDGKEITYTVEEVPVEGYTATIKKNDDGIYVITNTHEVEKVSVPVRKEWDDQGDQDGLRQKSVTVKLYADGVDTGKSLVLNDDNQWTGSFDDLDKYKDHGKEIVYTVQELDVEGYTATIKKNDDGIYVITNTHEVEKVSVPVTKKWNDSNNNDGKRPPSITVKLLADGVDTGKSLVLNGDNQWTGTFDDLDKYKDHGKEITYTVQELEVEYYDTTVTKNEDGSFTITNTHETEKVSVPVTKVWDDKADQDGVRKDSVTVRLYADGTYTDKSLVLNGDNQWTGSFNDLDKYKDGKEIDYTVQEVSIEGYTPTIMKNDDGVYVITNTHEVEKISIPVRKMWQDNNNNDGKRPPSITVKLLADGVDTGKSLVLNGDNQWTGTFDDLDKYKDHGKEITYTVQELEVEYYDTAVTKNEDGSFTITNTHETEKAQISVYKTWQDSDDQDGLRNFVTVYLYADGVDTGQSLVLDDTNQWMGSFDDLDKYKDQKEIDYTVKEEVIDGYTTEIVLINPGVYNIVNTHTPEKTKVSVTKKWVYEVDEEKPYLTPLLPDKVVVELFANGQTTGKTIELSATNQWTGSFEDLDKYKDKGKEIIYTVKELEVREFTSEITGNQSDGYTITNTYTPELISISGTKHWDDESDQDGVRPPSITVNLYADDYLFKSITVTADDDWSYTFKDLPKYRAGTTTQWTYSIEEEAVEDYTTEYDGYDIYNTHTPSTIDLRVSKVWEDKDGKDVDRPTEIVVYLLANGELTDYKLVLTADDDWTGCFKELDEYQDGNKIEYTVQEETIKGYTVKYSGNMKEGLVITNTLKAKAPDTGDHSHIYLWIAIFAISATSLVTATVIKKRKLTK